MRLHITMLEGAVTPQKKTNQQQKTKTTSTHNLRISFAILWFAKMPQLLGMMPLQKHVGNIYATPGIAHKKYQNKIKMIKPSLILRYISSFFLLLSRNISPPTFYGVSKLLRCLKGCGSQV